jgi:uncharacterized protein (DUF58 family)
VSLWRRWFGREATAAIEGLPSRPIAGLEVRARRLLDSMRAGASRSVFRGRGIEPDTVRTYTPGDDVRSIDWRVTARRRELHVREFEEERELDILLVVDRSASISRVEEVAVDRAVTEVAAALALAALDDGHRVGAITFTERVEAVVRPSRMRDSAGLILSALLAPARGRGTDLSGTVGTVRRLLPQRGLVIVISDFQEPEGVGVAATALGEVARRHEVVPIVVETRDAHALGDVGLVRVRDPESGRIRTIDTGKRATTVPAPGASLPRSLRAAGLVPLPLDPWKPLGPQLAPRFGGRSRRAA